MHRITRLLIALAVPLAAGQVQAETALEQAQERAERILSEDRGGPSEILYVGPGGSPCNYADLDDALAAASPNAEIRLTSGPFSGPFVTGEKSLAIVGGFASCSDSAPVGRTNLIGNNSSTVMTLLSSDGSASLELENLLIEDGSGGALAGGLDIQGGITVLLRNVLIRLSSTSSDGGGIRVAHSSNTDGALIVMLDQTELIDNNASSRGGGLACLGNGGSQHVVVLDNGRIISNNANTGGGVYARNCTFVSLAGGENQGITENLAENGGGIYATDGSQVALDGTAPGFLTPGNPEAPAELDGNAAFSSGGAVYITGSGTSFRAVDADIASNTANMAAAIYAGGGAEVVIERDPDTDCKRFDTPSSPPPCSRIRNNVSDDRLVIALSGDGAMHRISQTFIHGNQTSASVVSPLISLYSTVGAGTSELEIEGAVIHDNAVDFALFEIWNDTSLNVLWSTISDNSLGSSPFRLFNDIVESGGIAGQRLVYGSIVHQPGIAISGVQESDSFFFFCNIAHELGFPGQISLSLAADPMFIDPASDNYHVDAESPAVDFCAEGSWPPQYPDMDGETRGVATQSSSTPYDAGADESLDRIFSDRFFN